MEGLTDDQRRKAELIDALKRIQLQKLEGADLDPIPVNEPTVPEKLDPVPVPPAPEYDLNTLPPIQKWLMTKYHKIVEAKGRITRIAAFIRKMVELYRTLKNA